MPNFLLVSLRSGELAEQIAAAELRDFLRATRLDPADLTHVNIAEVSQTAGELDGYDGVLVGGSSLNITNPHWDEWQLHVHEEMARISGSGVPAFLVCYGASWLSHMHGGQVGPAHAEGSGPTVIELTEEGRRDPLCAGLPETFTSLTGHTESVELLGADLTVLATGPSCPVQFLRAGEHVWATQFHADMDAQAMKDRMDFYYDYGYFSPDDYHTIVASLPSINTTWSNRLLANFVDYCTSRAGARA
ncbi:glutamine amidotransferase [Corynebacterium hylobatis]|uniref:Glutamine amidotransferase n=1 Tax=Corynebacterium hylobatis TaxID=1859290 RepID=A0A3S0BGD1_9CORY|nr:glutamine amidotransferase [Corynebacterium hylobatis]RSZ63497.1 glutamine amidotransferase [Corynebacterium hylobatis]